MWCVVKLGTHSLSLLLSLLPLLFPFLFLSYLSFPLFFFFFFFSCSFSCSCSCSCSSSSFVLFLRSLFPLSSLLFPSRQQTLYSAFEAFECDVAHATFLATASELHGMFQPLLLPPLLSSLLPPSHTQKKERGLFITRIFPARELFCVTV